MFTRGNNRKDVFEIQQFIFSLEDKNIGINLKVIAFA